MPKRNNRQKFRKPRSRDIQLKTVDQEYAIIMEKFGDGRFLVQCDDGIERIGKVKGSLRNRVRFNVNDYVLLALRPDFNSYSSIMKKDFKETADIILKYFPQEVQFLQSNNHFKKLDCVTAKDDDEFDEFIQDNVDNQETEENTIEVLMFHLDDI